ncbi:hypothetical protein ACIQI8_27785 [Streptomyces sp. NPDC092369]
MQVEEGEQDLALHGSERRHSGEPMNAAISSAVAPIRAAACGSSDS